MVILLSFSDSLFAGINIADMLGCFQTGLEITFPTFPIMAIGNHDFLPTK